MLLTKTVKNKWSNTNKKWYENKGYIYTKKGDEFEVKVEDLQDGSNVLVDVKCDICGNNLKPIHWKDYIKIIKKNKKYCCYNCTHIIYTYEYVKKQYELAEFILLSKEYKSIDIPMKCICKKHSQYVQEKSFRMILDNRICYYCQHDIQKKEGHPHWKGGITPILQQIRYSDEYKEWREKVFKHDNYTCQCCGDNKGGNLEAHHIENFSNHEELRFDINNGITLCDKCHNPNQKGSFHNIYGTHNNTKEQLEKYIINYKIIQKLSNQAPP